MLLPRDEHRRPERRPCIVGLPYDASSSFLRGNRFAIDAELRDVLRCDIRHYNHTRAHSALGYRSPIAFERHAA